MLAPLRHITSWYIEHGTFNHFGKIRETKTYVFHLECGHTVTQYARTAGISKLERKRVRCEYCLEESHE